MMGVTHAESGFAAGFALVAVTHPAPLVAVSGPLICAAFALMPDLDHASSKATHSCGIPSEALSWIIRRLPGGKHRWALHSLTAVAVCAAVAAVIDAMIHGPWIWVVYAALGWAMHIAGDLMTDRPVRLLWPFSDRPVWGLPGWHTKVLGVTLKVRLTTNGPVERGAVRLWLALIIAGSLLLILRHITMTGAV